MTDANISSTISDTTLCLKCIMVTTLLTILIQISLKNLNNLRKKKSFVNKQVDHRVFSKE